MNQLLSSMGMDPTSNESYQADALELILADGEPQPVKRQAMLPPLAESPGVIVGTLVDVTASGEPIVRFPDDDSAMHRLARSVVSIDRHNVGSEVVLALENGRREHPIILGLLRSNHAAAAPLALPLSVTADSERVEITAEREIVLKCGKASITLTRAGKVLIRGAYLLSRSSGANRIKGGSVQIN